MTSRNEIVEWTNDYLKLHEYHDYGPMGLQHTGKEEVNKIATAVSVSYDTIRDAGKWGADMLFTHHGLWWNNESRRLDERTLGRIESLQHWNMSALGYHLCLDAHPEIGNNILLAKAIGLDEGTLQPFGEIGWGGAFSTTIKNGSLIASLRQDDHAFFYGTPNIAYAAVIAGGAPQYLTQAHREGYDLFVTGEAAEYTIYQASELKMNFLALGHHNTEKAGIKALGQKLYEEFGIEHRFFDAYNPI